MMTTTPDGSSGPHFECEPATQRRTRVPTERVIWDNEVAGLGRRERDRRQPVWIVQWRAGVRTIRRTLGPVAKLSLPQARKQASVLLDANRPAPAVRTAPLFRDFAETFLRDGEGRWKLSTQRSHRQDLKSELIPVFGDTRLDTVSRAQIRLWYEGRGHRAARALAVLSGLMWHAELLGLRPEGSNPCKGLRRKQSTFKARYLTPSEYRQLGRALSAMVSANPTEVALIRFLMLTGARRGEAEGLRWEYLQGARAVLPDSKTGPRTIWLPTTIQQQLATQPNRQASGPVFERNGKALKRHQVNAAWRDIRRRARLTGLRLHDLRHGFASVGVSHGEDLRAIAELLGHSDYSTTMAYAHLAAAPVAAAAQRVSTRLAYHLHPDAAANGIPADLGSPAKAKPVFIVPAIVRADPEIERRWDRLVRAYRQRSQPLAAFCAEHQLDPKEFHQALLRFQDRRRQAGAK